MHSTDGTQDICAGYPRCRIVERDDYIFANVNFGIDTATSQWILRLDSDERLTPELTSEIQGILANPPTNVIGFRCWERIFVLGHELTHGFGRHHHRKLLFRRGTARYPVAYEHEDLASAGAWKDTQHGYIHLNYRTVGAYLLKMNYYIDRDLERSPVPLQPPSTWRGILEAARAFYLYYLKHQGFRDGRVGLLDASMRAVYQWVTWAKRYERWKAAADDS